jgi:uncharacterized protein (UPF0261 family)
MPANNHKPRILLIVTQDTKEIEGRFLRHCLEEAGCEVVHLDPSVRRTVGGAEISPEAVAAAAGTTLEAVRAIGHEGKIQEVMIRGSIRCALQAEKNRPLSGILSIGGSMGTGLSTAVMPPLFADYVEKVMPRHVEVRRVDAHINDPLFADALADAVREMTWARATA